MLLGKFPTFLHWHDSISHTLHNVISSWCNCNGWLGIKHQVTYLPQCCWASSLPFFTDMTPSPTLSTILLGKFPTFLHGHDSLSHTLQCCWVSSIPYFTDMILSPTPFTTLFSKFPTFPPDMTLSPTLSTMLLGKFPTFLHWHDSASNTLHNVIG